MSRPENQLIYQHLADSERTLDPVANISVFRLFTRLRQDYGIGKPHAQNQSCTNFIDELERTLASIPSYRNDPSYGAVQSRIISIKTFSPETSGKDEWTKFYIYNQHGQLIVNNSFNLQEQFNLVCAATLHHNNNPDDIKARLLTLWNSLRDAAFDPHCSTGSRNDWAFSICACYPDIELIENFHGYILAQIKDHFETLLNTFNPVKQFKLLKTWITYSLQGEDSEQQDVDTINLLRWFKQEEIIITESLCEKAKKMALSEVECAQIKEFTASIGNGDMDAPDMHPNIPVIKLFLTELSKPIHQQAHPASLQIAKRMWDQRTSLKQFTICNLPVFWRIYTAFKNCQSKKNQHFLTKPDFSQINQILLDMTNSYLEDCAINGVEIAPPLPSDFEPSLNTFLELERIYKKERANAKVIANFLTHWNDPDNQNNRGSLYKSIYNIKESITISDEEIEQLGTDQLSNLPPNWLYRFILHAIVVPPDNWTPLFAIAYEVIDAHLNMSANPNFFTAETLAELAIPLKCYRIFTSNTSDKEKFDEWVSIFHNPAPILPKLVPIFIRQQIENLLHNASTDELHELLSYRSQKLGKELFFILCLDHSELLRQQPPTFFERIPPKLWLKPYHIIIEDNTTITTTAIEFLFKHNIALLAAQIPTFFEIMTFDILKSITGKNDADLLKFLVTDPLGQRILIKLPDALFQQVIKPVKSYRTILKLLQSLDSEIKPGPAFEAFIRQQIDDFYPAYNIVDPDNPAIYELHSPREKLIYMLEKFYEPLGHGDLVENFFAYFAIYSANQEKRLERLLFNLINDILRIAKVMPPNNNYLRHYNKMCLFILPCLTSPAAWNDDSENRTYFKRIIDKHAHLLETIDLKITFLSLLEICTIDSHGSDWAEEMKCHAWLRIPLPNLALLEDWHVFIIQKLEKVLEGMVSSNNTELNAFLSYKESRHDDTTFALLLRNHLELLAKFPQLLERSNPDLWNQPMAFPGASKPVTAFQSLFLNEKRKKIVSTFTPKFFAKISPEHWLTKLENCFLSPVEMLFANNLTLLAKQTPDFLARITVSMLINITEKSGDALTQFLQTDPTGQCILIKLPLAFFEEYPLLLRNFNDIVAMLRTLDPSVTSQSISSAFETIITTQLKRILTIYDALRLAQDSLLPKTNQWQALAQQLTTGNLTFIQIKTALITLADYAVAHPDSRTAYAINHSNKENEQHLLADIIRYGHQRSHLFARYNGSNNARIEGIKNILRSFTS